MKISEKATYIINTLNKKGFEAYLVGGCVRDNIMEVSPKDWDIASSALPDEVKGIFEKCIETGIRHGTVTVIIENESFEVTTFRVDGSYTDGRRPDKVEFTSSIYEDLSRRDFTINSIAWHPDKGFIDPFNGIIDIRKKLIQTVGDPDKRFNEDALRMLRAIRFSAQLNFEIDPETLASIKVNSKLICKISGERIRDELSKILISSAPQKLTLLRDTDLLQYILPEFDICYETEQNNPYHVFNVALHTLKAVSEIERTLILRWTMLLHDIGKPPCKTTDIKKIDHFYNHQKESVLIADKILKRLKFDTFSTNKILNLIEHHDIDIHSTPESVRKTIHKVGKNNFCDLLKVQAADKLAQNPEKLGDRIMNLNKIMGIFEEILNQQQCLALDNLAINGNDLLALGINKGPEIGSTLNSLLCLVLENPELNTKEKLKELVKSM